MSGANPRSGRVVAPARPGGAPAARRRLAPAERRLQILDAAAHAFVDEGYVSTTIASIARTAGVTPRIVYQHYPSKDALYRAILDRTAVSLAALFSEPTGRYGIDIGRLMTAARADADGFRIMWRHAAHEREFAPLVATTRAQAVGCARAALASWTPADALDFAAQSVVGQILERVLVMLEYGDPDDDARFARSVKASLGAAVRAWAAEP